MHLQWCAISDDRFLSFQQHLYNNIYLFILYYCFLFKFYRSSLTRDVIEHLKCRRITYTFVIVFLETIHLVVWFFFFFIASTCMYRKYREKAKQKDENFYPNK